MRYQWWAGDMKVMSSIGSGETHVSKILHDYRVVQGLGAYPLPRPWF